MRAPSEAAHHMAKTPNGVERGIERYTPHSVIDDIEAVAAGVIADILLRGCLLTVDCRCAQALDGVPLRSFVDREDLGSESRSDLDRHRPDASSTQNKHLLTGLDLGPV